MSFYGGKRVFVTGHTGFKGSWLSSVLLLAGAEVFGYALEPPTNPSMFEMLNLAKNMDSTIGDIRDYESLYKALSAAKPEIVFHLAAQPIVRLSYAQPLDTFSTNVVGTADILEAVRHLHCVKAAVIVTTDKVYENRELQYGYRETDRLGGSDPYAASKACAEIVAASYRESFFGENGNEASIATARAGNVIGGGDFAADRILPDCVRYTRRGLPVPLRNAGSVRPWQYVLEPLRGYLMLARGLAAGKKEFCGAFNFGPDDGENVTTGQLAGMFCKEWGDGAAWEDVGNKGAPHETACLRLDNSKAWRVLGWRPRLGVRKAVGLSVAWEKAQGDKAAVTKQQIEDYFCKK